MIDLVSGYLVLGIDYFEGDTIFLHLGKPEFKIKEWVDPKLVRARELVPKWIDAVKEQFGGFSPFGKWEIVHSVWS